MKSRQLVPLSVAIDLDYVVTSAHRPSSSLMVLIETELGGRRQRSASSSGHGAVSHILVAGRPANARLMVARASGRARSRGRSRGSGGRVQKGPFARDVPQDVGRWHTLGKATYGTTSGGA